MNIIDYFVYLIFRFFHCPPVGKNANDAKLFSVMIAGWIMGMFIMTIGYSYLLCTKNELVFFLKDRSPVIGMVVTFVIWIFLFLDHYLIRKEVIVLLDKKYKLFTPLKRRIIKWMTIISIIMVVVTLFILNRYVDMLHS
ncbi:hypothetical protein [Bacteroides caecimuris]|uniref:hypothetical protein n=1 Tax=Bacteroides caecimuris TaxID=1796613 RepID=UPI00242DCC14|nr:hypothetical protein [Bacteroides caecimuris]